MLGTGINAVTVVHSLQFVQFHKPLSPVNQGSQNPELAKVFPQSHKIALSRTQVSILGSEELLR